MPLTVEPADATPQGRQEWLVDGIWPLGGVGIIGGPPKSRKTWLALALAASAATGQPFLDHWESAGPMRVLYLAGEDKPGSLKQRLGDAAPWVDACHDQARLDTLQGIGDVSDAIERTGAGLLVIDPLVRFHRASESSLGPMRELFAGLRALSNQHRCSIIVVHHSKKGGQGGQGLRGSSELHAWGDANIYPSPTGRVSVELRCAPGTSFRVQIRDGRLALAAPATAWHLPESMRRKQ